MKKKNCKLTSILRVIALPLVGSAGGWLYYRYVGCVTGTCAVTSSPWLSTGFGCVLGSLILCQEKVQIKNDFFPSCQHT